MEAFIDQQTVVILYIAGISVEEIAKQFDCSLSGIYRILRKRDCYLPQNRRRFDNDTESKIVEKYNQGGSLDGLAEDYGCNKSTIANILKRHGVKVRRPGTPGNGGKTCVHGYTYVSLPPDDPFHSMMNSKGYVAEHRYVMANHLGRKIEDHETVHHIDGDRSNNDIGNLQLRSGKHGKGVVHVCLKCGSYDVKSIEVAA